jgi:hypothetical protein
MEIYVSELFRRALWVIFAAVGSCCYCLCQHRKPFVGPRNGLVERDGPFVPALGAGRWRIARQLLTESICYRLWRIDWPGSRTFGYKADSLMSPDSIPRARAIGLDWKVLSFTLVVAFPHRNSFGLVPALQAGELML